MNTTYSKIRCFFREKNVGDVPGTHNSLIYGNSAPASSVGKNFSLSLFSILLFFVFTSNQIFSQSTITVPDFTTTGLSTWTAPAGVTSITVYAWGGGGGGGGGKGGLLGGPAGGGGGSGAYSIYTNLTVVPGSIYNIGVGGGGGAGSSNNNGTAGNSSYFSSPGTSGTQLVAAVGGNGGVAGGAAGTGGAGASGIGTTLTSGANGSGTTGGSSPSGGSGGGTNNVGNSPGGGGGGGAGGGFLSGGGHAGGNGGIGTVRITYSLPGTLVIGTNAAVTAANICPSTTTVPLHSFSLTGANNPGTFTDYSIMLGGTYKQTGTGPDIANLKLWTTGTTSTFTAPVLLATIAAPSSLATQTFPAFSQAIGNATIYFWVTFDVSPSGTVVNGHTIFAIGTLPGNITAAQTPTGFSNLSGTQTLGVGATPAAPVATAATNVACTSFSANWNASAATSGYFLDVSTVSTFTAGMVANNVSVLDVLTYNVTGLTTGTTYYYRVRADKCGSTSANSGTITVVTVAIPADPANPTFAGTCNPVTGTLTQNTTGLVAPNALYWQGTNAAGTSTALPATSTYATTVAGMYYIRTKTTGGCWSAGSGSYNVIISDVTGGTIADNQSICGNQTPVAFSSTVDGTGAPLSYTWQYDATSAFSAPTTVGGAVFNNYAPPSFASTRYYRRVSTSGSCSAYSNTLQIEVAPTPTIVASANVTICSGSSTHLSASGSNTNTYSWLNTLGLGSPSTYSTTANPTVTTTYTVTGWGTSTEKVINGNFNSVSPAGFTSDYVNWPITTTGDMSEGRYSIVTMGHKATAATTTGPGVHSLFSTTLDHTGGATRNQLVVNGAGNPGANVWCEPFTVAPNSDYAFSTWVSTQHLGDGTVNALAKLQFSINGIVIGSPFLAPNTIGPWQQFFANWNSGNSTTCTICVVNLNTTANGNDFAMDDMSFAPYCSGTSTVTVTVPYPVLSSSKTPAAVCSGTAFTYTATSTFPSPTFTWSRAAVAGISNGAAASTGNINETLINTTTGPINVTYIYHTTSQTCVGAAESVVVTINPKPTLNSALTATICSGTASGYQATSATTGATFAWARATVAGITEAGTSGATNPLTETLTNTTGVPINVTYTYTTTANGCVSSTQNVVITVKASVTLSSSLTPPAICSGAAFGYTATSANGSATFAWSRAAVAGISQALSSGTTNPVSETLTNTTASTINVTYVYTITANGCSNTQNVVVAVNPGPTLNSTLTGAVCSGSTFGYTPTSATSPITYAWTRAAVATINANAAGSGVANISEVLTSSSTSTVTVNYVYTATSNGCVGPAQTLVVTVNPLPAISVLTAAVCSGVTFTYTPTSATTGATFSWSRAAVVGITQGGTANTGGISEVLDNTTTAAIPVIYKYTTTANGCTGAVQNLTLTVNALPIINSTLTPSAICSGTAFSYVPASATAGPPTFSWTRAAIANITPAGPTSGAGNPNETLTNSSTSPINVTYGYISTYAGCSGTQINMVVTVNPLPNGIFFGNTVCTSTGDVPQLTFQSTAGTGPFTLIENQQTPSVVAQTVPNPITTNVPWAPNAAPVTTSSGVYTYNLTSITDANGCVRTAAIAVPTATINITSAAISADPTTPSNQISCTNSPSTFSVNATGVQTWSWEVNTTGAHGGTYNPVGPWTAITGSEPAPTYNGVTSPSLVVSNTDSTLNSGYRFRANMLAACGSNVYSSIAKLTVNPVPTFTTSLAPTPATCSGNNVIYTPGSGTGGVTYAWSRAVVVGITQASVTATGSGPINELLTNITPDPINVTYNYAVTNPANSCVSSPNNVVVTINPAPVLSSMTGNIASLCSPATPAYTPASASSNPTFAWTLSAPGLGTTVTSGTGSISGVLTNTTTANIDATYSYTTTASTCPGSSQNVVVTVEPLPTLSSANPTSVCSGTTFVYTPATATPGTTTYSWSRNQPAGILEPATSGNGGVSETLTNATSAIIPVTYVYTVTTNGCAGVAINVIVNVYPTPVLSSSLTQSVCSGVSNTYTPISGVTGTTFIWARAHVANITAGTDPNSGTGAATETLTNGTTAPINVIYVITPSANGCAAPAQNVVVTVNPIPILSSTLTAAPMCSETAVDFSYLPTSATPGATFAWTRAAIASINDGVTPGSGAGVVNEVLTNTSTGAVTVNYLYTTTANGCSNTSQTVAVSVKPRPVLSSVAAKTICSGLAVSYTALSATGAGAATFAWSRASLAGITAATDPNSGTANPITEVLTNTTTSPIDVPYLYTTSFSGCSSASPNTVIVTVIPTPVMTSAAVATICTGTSLATNGTLVFTSNVPSDYGWTRTNTVNIGPGCGPTCTGISPAANPITEILTNVTAASLPTTYNVTPTSNPGGCLGSAQPVIVSVTPVPAQPNGINGNPN